MKKTLPLAIVLVLSCSLVSAYLPLGDGNPSPREAISDTATELLNKPGVLGTTEESILYFRGVGLVLGSGVPSPHDSDATVCLSLGRFKESSEWVDGSPTALHYVGEGRLWVGFSVMCDNGGNLESSILANGGNKILLDDVENCGCIGRDEMCCVAVLSEAKSAEGDIALGGFINNLINFLTPISFLLFFVGLVLIFFSSKNRLLQVVYLAKIPVMLYVLLGYVSYPLHNKFSFLPRSESLLIDMGLLFVLALISIYCLIKFKGKNQKKRLYGMALILAAELMLMLFTGIFWYRIANAYHWDLLDFVS